MSINAPSLANIPLTAFGEQLKELYEGGIRFFHVDIMDGHYVKNLCLPLRAVSDVKRLYPDAVVEVHMMVEDPLTYVQPLKAAGAGYAAFHIDSTHFVRRTLTEIQAAGMKAGVVLNPSQRIDVLEPFVELLDYCVFMSVEPGFAGQRFLPGAEKRLRELACFRRDKGLSFQIIVDGGVTLDNAALCVRNGADILVTGIYVVFAQACGIVEACRCFDRLLKDVRSEV